MNQKRKNRGEIKESEPLRYILGKKKIWGAWKELSFYTMGCYARQHQEALSNIL